MGNSGRTSNTDKKSRQAKQKKSRKNSRSFANWMRWAFVFESRPAGPAAWKRIAGTAVLVIVIGLLVSPHYVVENTLSAVPNDGHALASMALAMNWIYCGKFSQVSSRYNVSQTLLSLGPGFYQPLSSVPVALAGSSAQYCSTVDTPFLNNENTLMYVMSAILRGTPNISVFTMGRALL